MSTLAVDKFIQQSKQLGAFVSMFNSVRMDKTKDRKNHTGNKEIKWFNGEIVGLKQDRGSVALSFKEPNKLEREIKIEELLGKAADWIKDSLQEIKKLELTSLKPTQALEDDLTRLKSNLSTLKKESDSLFTERDNLSGELASLHIKHEVLKKKHDLLGKFSVVLFASTLLAFSFPMSMMNLVGFIGSI